MFGVCSMSEATVYGQRGKRGSRSFTGVAVLTLSDMGKSLFITTYIRSRKTNSLGIFVSKNVFRNKKEMLFER